MTPEPRHILGVSGSPRRGGNTDWLLDHALAAAAAKGATTERVHLRDYSIAPCVGCERCRTEPTCTRFLDGMHLLYPKLERAEGLVIGSPTHNYNVTAWVKAFIDRLYPYYVFAEQRPGSWGSRLAGQGRVAITFEVCEQEDPAEASLTLEALGRPLEALGYEVCAAVPVLGHFAKGSARNDRKALARLGAAAERLVSRLESQGT